MNASSIHDVILVRCAEEADAKGEQISRAKREEATKLASAQAAGADLWRMLAARAAILRKDALEVVGPAIEPRFHPLRTGAALCLLAGILGAMSHEVGMSQSFDLLAGPFLVVFAWNAIVYLFLIARFFRISNANAGWATRWIVGKIEHPEAGKAGHARSMYLGAMASWLRPWAMSWTASCLHAGSACYALGLLAAIYVRGLNTNYFAGWESTWLGPESIRSIVGFILGPASRVSGIPLPGSAADWAALRRMPGAAGVSAAPWIHLYAITMLGWVVVPRLALWAMAGLQSMRLRSRPPLWLPDDPYVRRILNAMRSGGDLGIAILPFDIKNPDFVRNGACRDGIEGLIRETWGRGARSRWFDCLQYGAEEEQLHGILANLDCDGGIVLLDVGATPEDEVHGMFLDEVIRHFRGSRGGVLAVVETARYDAQRQESRMRLWKNFAAGRGIDVLPVHAGSCRDPRSVASAHIHHPN